MVIIQKLTKENCKDGIQIVIKNMYTDKKGNEYFDIYLMDMLRRGKAKLFSGLNLREEKQGIINRGYKVTVYSGYVEYNADIYKMRISAKGLISICNKNSLNYTCVNNDLVNIGDNIMHKGHYANDLIMMCEKALRRGDKVPDIAFCKLGKGYRSDIAKEENAEQLRLWHKK